MWSELRLRLGPDVALRGLLTETANRTHHCSPAIVARDEATRMGGAKRYPSIAVHGVDGFRKALNPSCVPISTNSPLPRHYYSIIGRPIQTLLSERTARSGCLLPCKRAMAS